MRPSALLILAVLGLGLTGLGAWDRTVPALAVSVLSCTEREGQVQLSGHIVSSISCVKKVTERQRGGRVELTVWVGPCPAQVADEATRYTVTVNLREGVEEIVFVHGQNERVAWKRGTGAVP